MAELAGVQELHTVDDAEADAVFEYCKHAIPHNEMIGRIIRNMYGRLQVLEKEVAALKKANAECSSLIHSHLDRLQRTNLVVVKIKFLEIDFND